MAQPCEAVPRAARRGYRDATLVKRSPVRVVCVEPAGAVADVIARALEAEGVACVVQRVPNGEALATALSAEPADVAVGGDPEAEGEGAKGERASIAHDLRNALGAICMNVEVLRLGDLPESVRERCFAEIASAARRATALALRVQGGGRSAEVSPAVSAAPAKAPPRPRPGPVGRVLVVDDERVLAEVTARLLTRAGHHATSLLDPHAALALVEADPGAFDLVVTDHAMPRMNGIDLARAIRAAAPGLPVVLTTGLVASSRDEEARAAGIVEVLYKPFEPEALVEVVARTLASAR